MERKVTVMSTTSNSHVGIGQKRKTVHFHSSLNWEEEANRSSLGMESRRKRRELRRRLKRNTKQRYQGIIDIIQDPKFEDRVQTLYDKDEIVKLSLNLFFADEELETPHSRLVPFQNSDQDFVPLPDDQNQAVRVLSVNDAFTREFKNELPVRLLCQVYQKRWTQTEKNSRKRQAREMYTYHNHQKHSAVLARSTVLSFQVLIFTIIIDMPRKSSC